MTSHEDRRLDRLSTSREYQMEAEHTRRRLADNLDELSDRLTPGQVFDEMLTYSRAGGGTFYRALSNAMRDNPFPSLLIGAGCMMFLSEKMGLRPGLSTGSFGRRAVETADAPYNSRFDGGSVSRASTGAAASTAREAAASLQAGVQGTAHRAAERASRGAAAVSDTMRNTASAIGDTVSGAAGAASDTVRQTASAAGDTVSGAAEAVSGTVRDAAATIGDTFYGAADAMRSTTQTLTDQASGALRNVRRGAAGAAGTMRETASSVAQGARRGAVEAARNSRETAASFITEQPLLSAAIGVAIGAAIASLLPTSETENELMGEASDRVKDVAGQAASEGLGSAKTVAGKVAERAQSAARDAVHEEGLTSSAFAEAARNVGLGMKEGAAKQPVSGSGPQELTESEPRTAATDFQ